MNQGEPKKLLKTARRFWAVVYGWITWPLNQFDPLTCTPALLNLLAYDRDITRFDGEPLSLFRKRVAYAFVNARDAGSVEGFIDVFLNGWALGMWSCGSASQVLTGMYDPGSCDGQPDSGQHAAAYPDNPAVWANMPPLSVLR